MTDKKQILLIIGFIILLVAIPVTSYLVRQSQIIKSRAAFTTTADFLDSAGANANIVQETKSTSVWLRITHKEAPSSTPNPTLVPAPTAASTPVASASPMPGAITCAKFVNNSGTLISNQLCFVGNGDGAYFSPSSSKPSQFPNSDPAANGGPNLYIKCADIPAHVAAFNCSDSAAMGHSIFFSPGMPFYSSAISSTTAGDVLQMYPASTNPNQLYNVILRN